MAQSTTAAPDFRTPRPFLDPRGFTRNLIERRSWFFGFILIDVLVIYAIVTNPVSSKPGISSGRVSPPRYKSPLKSFLLATIVGMLIALLRLSKNILIYNTATLYVELFRGLPLLVIILIFAFALKPAFINFAAGIPVLDDLVQRVAVSIRI